MHIDNKLVPSIASESLATALVQIADTSIDAAIRSGALDGVPVIGIVTGAMKVARDVREAFLLRKLAIFLGATTELSFEERTAFARSFADPNDREEFGGALLVLIERAEDIEKPKILGRLLTAHVRGAFDKAALLRMSKMVDRSYFEDLLLLKSFSPGLLASSGVAAQSLSAVGFLSQAGFDGGDARENSGGILYRLNEYGAWLVQHAL